MLPQADRFRADASLGTCNLRIPASSQFDNSDESDDDDDDDEERITLDLEGDGTLDVSFKIKVCMPKIMWGKFEKQLLKVSKTLKKNAKTRN